MKKENFSKEKKGERSLEIAKMLHVLDHFSSEAAEDRISELEAELTELYQKEDKCEFYPGPDDGCVCAAGSDIAGPFFCTKEYSQECPWAIERRKQEPKLHMRHKKTLIIDALDYPLIRVTKPLSMRGALKSDMLYGDEGEEVFFEAFYDYQPEDLEGSEKNG